MELIEHGLVDEDEEDGSKEVGENSSTALEVPKQSTIDHSPTASSEESEEEGEEERQKPKQTDIIQGEKSQPQRHSLNVEDASKKAKRGQVAAAVPHTVSPRDPKELEKRASLKGKGREGMKVIGEKEGGRVPQRSSLGDPKEVGRQQEKRYKEQQRQGKEKTTQETTPARVMVTQKGNDYN